ncbi:MAG: glycoside hydrolase family 2 TIM barrel-domain containing protein [Verrucomicrobiota bacterium]
MDSNHTRFLCLFTVMATAAGMRPASAVETEVRYLSGRGPKDAVPWEFSVTKGRRAGEKTTIPVPSNWEQQGFGTYNYGETAGAKADEHGLYRLKFSVPDEWKGRRIRIVFDGVMTDAEVKVNGRLAGPVHQGGFYRFRQDITDLLKPGQENLLEVDVSKVSANAQTERAERGGDYWVFGGIFRPVFLEAVPAQSIDRVAVDAGADGTFKVDVAFGSVRDADKLEAQILTTDGTPVGGPFSTEIPGGGTSDVRLSAKVDAPKLWTAETPNLYQAKFTLRKGGQEIHTVTQRFGFRTIELRKGGGFFLNGKHILLKGVCRHSFRAETGRSLNPEDCYDDVRLIKGMNMNAARMTHYPPDVAFLEACDELGLYVIDELSGWQRAHGTEVGRKLVREMVTRDVNHPSILFWDNGNEGGWNRELDGEFKLYDPQNRIVLHPWEPFNGVDTKHYPDFKDLTKRLAGPNVVMPTEMIHGLYDGGAGAGLEDYWKAIAASPVGGGGFIWVLADEGIMRTDQGNRIDVYSSYAPDGIVGPRHEKKGSYHTVRDVFSPVQIDTPVLDRKFTGNLTVHNRYDFLPLGGCRFNWRLLRFPDPSNAEAPPIVLGTGEAAPPEIVAGATGTLKLDLPEKWTDADALSLVATDSTGQQLWVWSWPTAGLGERVAARGKADGKTAVDSQPDEITLKTADVTASFDAKTGLLKSLGRGGRASALTNGPRVVHARPAKGDVPWTDAQLAPAVDGAIVWKPETPKLLNVLDIELNFPQDINWAGFKLEISPDGRKWKTLYDATRRTRDGNLYEFPPQLVAAVRLSDLRQVDGQPATVKRMRAAYQAERFPADPPPMTVSSGTDEGSAWVESKDANGSDRFRWTLSATGALKLDYSYTLDGDVTYHGITFDHPEDQFKSVKWLGEGPSRVWQNRLRGTKLGTYEIARNDIQPGESWTFPEFQGCFAGLQWALFATEAGDLTISSASPGTYLRIGTPRISHPYTTVAFPAGDLSFLKAIPAIGSKFTLPDKTGPTSEAAKASGQQTGSVVFQLGK